MKGADRLLKLCEALQRAQAAERHCAKALADVKAEHAKALESLASSRAEFAEYAEQVLAGQDDDEPVPAPAVEVGPVTVVAEAETLKP